MDANRDYEAEFEAKLAEQKTIEFEKSLNEKRPKPYSLGSKFTKPKKKRKR